MTHFDCNIFPHENLNVKIIYNKKFKEQVSPRMPCLEGDLIMLKTTSQTMDTILGS